MAANYYSFDSAKGMQDYNYYQLGLANKPTNAYMSPSSSSQVVYEYPEEGDNVIIIDEINNSEGTWYKLQSDKIINGNTITTLGDYNWNSYVYVKKENITKINKAKNGYKSSNDVTKYKDAAYSYDLYIENATLKPKVAIIDNDVDYYFDSTLEEKTGHRLLKDKWVMVYAEAKNESGKTVSYLVTSNYNNDQKHWIKAGNMHFQTTGYGKVTVTNKGYYTWVNSNTEDTKQTLIGGLYTNTYVPLVTSTNANGYTWYKVPSNLEENTNSFGWTIANGPDASFEFTMYNADEDNKNINITSNNPPVITANDKEIIQGNKFDELKDVKATDEEDGDITSKVTVSGKVDTEKVGTYKIVYEVIDSKNEKSSKEINVTVKENNKPEIIANDKTIIEGEEFDELKEVTAKDKEDGDLTSKIKVKENTVKETQGTYKVVYEVSDSKGKTTTKEIKVVVEEQSIEEKPKDINPESTKIEEDISDYDIDELLEKQEDGQFNLESLEFNKNTNKFSISGYLIIDGVDNIDKEYALVLVNKNDEDKTYAVNIDSWTKDIPYNLGTVDGHNYEDIWFKGNIDFTDIPNGDYDLYMLGANENSFTIQLVDNFFGVDISKRGEDANHGYNFKVRSDLRTQQIELNIRDELYTTSVSPTYRDMVNEFDTILFKNNKLYLKGYSYNYGGTYKEQLNITRKLLLENTSTYKQEVFELGSSKGLFDIKTKDNKDKTYAWYENEIDLSKLEKGVYSLQVYTKTIDAEDYGEITDMFEELNEKATIGDKNFIITYNKNKQDRIELTIK